MSHLLLSTCLAFFLGAASLAAEELSKAPIITDQELRNMPSEVADRVLDLMQHGDRYETAIRQIADFWASEGGAATYSCGGLEDDAELGVGV